MLVEKMPQGLYKYFTNDSRNNIRQWFPNFWSGPPAERLIAELTKKIY